jgi:CubicO group peptidase (beta-lactamase class C family)
MAPKLSERTPERSDRLHSRLGACCILSIAALLASAPADGPRADETMKARIEALVPDLQSYIEKGMTAFDDPGLTIGIVSGDDLVYAKGFGVRRKGGEAVDLDTVFQIGSTTKAFLATTIAIAVDRKKLAWDDRVVDHFPDFQMKDAWVTREFRVQDLLAQRSGMPPFANDLVGLLGADQSAMIRSLRDVQPVSSFRSTFAYTNITHVLAQRVVAHALGVEDWDTLVRETIFEPLGMTHSSFTAGAMEDAPNHSQGYRWSPGGAIEVPFTSIFPYEFGGAGAINSNVVDLSRWVRLHLAGGIFDGKRIVSAENLAVTKTPRIGINDKLFYAMGWVVQVTPNGRIVWHNGGTASFGAYIGTALDKGVGVIVLTNETNVGFPDAVGEWVLDRLMGNPVVDHVAAKLEDAKAGFAATEKIFAAPVARRPPPPLAWLTGSFANPSFGSVDVTAAGDGLMVELKTTGAKLRLEPRDGEVFVVRLVAEGRFAAVGANFGPSPLGFAQFLTNKDGSIDHFVFIAEENGQSYEFAR